MTTLPERIKIARERKGWTANRLGVEAGLSQGMIYRLESGERAKRGGSTDTLAKVARALGVRMQWLVDGSGSMEETSAEAPARTAASAIAREGGVHAEAIRLVLAEPVDADDAARPILWWIDRMRRRELDLMSSPKPPPRRRGALPAPAAPAKSGRRRKASEDEAGGAELPAGKPKR